MSYTAPIKDMVFNMEHLAGLDALAQAIPEFADAGVETVALIRGYNRGRKCSPTSGSTKTSWEAAMPPLYAPENALK